MAARRRPSAWWLPGLAALSCASDPERLEATGRFDTEIPNVMRVRVDTAGPATAHVRWGRNRNTLDQRTPPTTGSQHDLRVLGLPQNEQIWWQAVAVHNDGTEQVSRIHKRVVHDTGMPALQINIHDPDRSELSTGYAFVVLLGDDWTGVAAYAADGIPVWGWLPPNDLTAAAPHGARSGTDLLLTLMVRDRDIDGTQMRRIPMNGDPHTITPATAGHHLFVELPDQQLAWPAFTFAELDVSGLDEATEPTWEVMTDQIRVVTEGEPSTERVLFDYLTDHPIDFFVPCGHTTNPIDRIGHTGVHEWTHVNSLATVDETETLLFGSRLHDSVTALDLRTGEVRWQAGGVGADLTSDDPWFHSHWTHAWDDRVLMFDNHLHQGERSVSRVIEVAFDPSNGTATTMWEFTQPNLGFTPWMGDARRLPGGNTLVAFTLTGRLYEVTPQGEVVWAAQAPAGMPVTRIPFAPHLYDLNAP